MAVMKPELSPLERATLFLAYLRTRVVALITMVTALWRGSSGSAKYGNHVKLAALRTFLDHTTVRHQQYINPDLDEAYPAFAKKHGFTPKDVILPDGTKAYWLGDPSAENVILWFHGGGYNLPVGEGHIAFVHSLTSPSVSALMLSYTLAPHATYPRQLQQGVALLRHTLTALHRPPETIILGGDSAGANLAVGILSHILHPHPQIPPLRLDDDDDDDDGGSKSKSKRLRAAILLAPWASFDLDWPSMKRNARKDCISPSVTASWSLSFLGGNMSNRDAYSEPLGPGTPRDWWVGLETVLDGCLVTGGKDEVLADVVRELGRRFQDAFGGGSGDGGKEKVMVLVAEGEWHDRPVLEVLGGGGVQDEAIRRFVGARV